MTCPHGKYEQGKCVLPNCDYVCPHEMFWGGMCAICGIHEDQGKSGSSSAEHINISHRDTGIAVSVNEAKRIAKEDEKRLLKEKKLSLIVDLDQTILHATWEPYIANWVKERKAENNPVVKDISQFTLDGSPLIYSIKLRPGLREFLQEISRKYEMHIYTMGTRSYADAVVKVIDPDGRLFQDRILSRDENGSATRKRLERLFPFDQSRVVVLDDRADVWDYSENLIQIKPYEYFIGIGDINSPFAQPKIDIIPSTDELTQPSTTPLNVNNIKPENDSTSTPQTNGTATTTVNENEKKQEEKKAVPDTAEAQQKIEAETTLKEVEKTEAAKEEEEEEEEEDLYSDAEDEDNNSVTPSVSSIESNLPKKKDKGKEKAHDNLPSTANDSKEHLPNTHDTDDILRVMRRALLDVHNVYFRDLESGKTPHVAPILNSLKARVLNGVSVVFSGVIPINNPGPNTLAYPQHHWIWRMATSFGASCLHELTGKVTHLVAVNPGTSKVHTARKYGNIKIVLPAWITDSVWNWKSQNETQYLLPLAELSPAESEVENPESTSLEIDFGWDDDEVDEALGDESDDSDMDDLDEDFDESDIGSNLRSEAESSSNQVNGQVEATSSSSATPAQNGAVEHSEDEEELDDDFLGNEMDAIFDDSDEGDEREYGESDDDFENDTATKRSRDDDDDDDFDEEDHPSKKYIM